MTSKRQTEEFAPRAVVSTFDCAKLALGHVCEWAKWMSGVQTAAIGGLSAIVMNVNNPPLTCSQKICVIGAFIFLSLALLFSAWTLSAVASLALRLHSMGEATVASRRFDIFEQPSFTWPGGRSVPLGLLMAFQHWSWAFGLGLFAAFFIIRYLTH